MCIVFNPLSRRDRSGESSGESYALGLGSDNNGAADADESPSARTDGFRVAFVLRSLQKGVRAVPNLRRGALVPSAVGSASCAWYSQK